jgi:hypothetical protein
MLRSTIHRYTLIKKCTVTLLLSINGSIIKIKNCITVSRIKEGSFILLFWKGSSCISIAWRSKEPRQKTRFSNSLEIKSALIIKF